MPSLSPGLIRRWRALTERVRDGADLDQADRLEAAFVLQKLPGRRVVKAMRRERAAGEKAERAGRRERMGAIRVAVRDRAAGFCEVCRLAPVAEVHHVLSGPDRRSREAVQTCIATCVPCHRGLHAGDKGTLELVALWARSFDYREALAAVERRLSKIAEARA